MGRRLVFVTQQFDPEDPLLASFCSSEPGAGSDVGAILTRARERSFAVPDVAFRLALERLLFTSTDQSLGEKTLTLARQSAEGGSYALYSENVRWRLGPVVYIGLNVQGSNDNYPYPDTDVEGGATVPVRNTFPRRSSDE